MKTFVKILCVLMCLLMALSVLSACNDKKEPDNPPDDKQSDTPVDNPDHPDDPKPDDPKPDDPKPDDPTPDKPDKPEDMMDDIMQKKYPGKKITAIIYPEDLFAVVNFINDNAGDESLTENVVYYLADDLDLNPGWSAAARSRDGKLITANAPNNVFPGFEGFYGIFDGNGHTLSGLYIENSELESGDALGFFKVFGGTVKDLTIANSSICGMLFDGETAEDVNIGALAGTVIGDDCTLENITFFGVNVFFYTDDDCPAIGGAIGALEGDNLTLNNVSFFGKVGLIATDDTYPSAAENATVAQFLGNANGNDVTFESCTAGGSIGVAGEPETLNVFCATGAENVTLDDDCSVEKASEEEGEDNVIEIYVAEDLAVLWGEDDYEGKTIRLMSDIDFNPDFDIETARFKNEVKKPTRFWEGIPNFKGTFDGNGYMITGLVRLVDATKVNYVGGIADTLGDGAVIKNLTIQNSAVVLYVPDGFAAGGLSVGAVAGKAEGNVTLDTLILDCDIWTLDDIPGFYDGIIPQLSGSSAVITANETYHLGVIGSLDRALLEEVFEKLDPYTESDTIVIDVYTKADLLQVMQDAQDGADFDGYTIRLHANIDLNPGWNAQAYLNNLTNRITFPINSQAEEDAITVWKPFPAFAGVFDGNGFAISGLYAWRNALCINSADYGGFANVVKDNGIIKNLIIKNSLHVVNNTGDAAWGSRNIHVGGLVGVCDRTVGTEDTNRYGMTISNVYVDMDVVLLCSNHGCVGGILAFSKSHGSTVPYRLSNVVFAGRIINTDFTKKVPFKSPKDQFAMAQIVADSNWTSAAIISNVLAAGQIICGNTSGVHAIFGVQTYRGGNGNTPSVSNALDGRHAEMPKYCFNPKTDNNDAKFNGNSWTYSADLGFYLQQSVKKMLEANADYEDVVKCLDAPFVPSETADAIHVSTAAELIALAESGNDFCGKTIYIDNDIDFNPGWSAKTKIVDGAIVFPTAPAVTWTAFANFKGAINGQGHTIKGLYSLRTVVSSKGNYGGLIDTQSDGNIRDLAIVNSILIARNTSYGSKDIHVGGLTGQINKTTVKTADKNKNKYALGNSENYGLIVSRFYTDMETWYVSEEQACIGGFAGFINAKYTFEEFVFAGKVGNTDSLSGGSASYASAKGNSLAMGQIIGCGNFHTGVYIEDAVVVGSIITGTTGADAKYIHTCIGSDDKASYRRCVTELTTLLPDGVEPIDGWEVAAGGFFVHSNATQFANDYVVVLATKGTEVTGLTLAPKGSASDVTISFNGISIVVPEGVTSVAASAFAGAPDITSIAFPTSLTSIGESAFANCTALTSVTYAGTMNEWNAIEMTGAWDEDVPYDIICTDGAACVHHTWDDGVVTKEKTCLEHGNRKYTCTVCGSNKNVLILSPLEHKLVSDPATATCTAGGLSEGAHCLVCGEIITPQVLVEALGHDYNSEGKCKRCGAKKPSEGLAFASNGDGTCTVTGLGTYTDLSVAIPSESPDGDTVTAIGNFAFANTAITSVQIPVTVVSIGTGAFANCSALEIKVETVMEGNPVYTSTANGIFKDDGATLVRFTAVKTTTYQLPATVTTIEEYAFSGCSKLINFSVNASNPNYKAAGNNIYTKDGTTLVRAKNASSVTIAAGTVNIANGAFSGCDKLTKITLVSSVESIGDYGFYGCSKLATVTNNATNLKHVGTDAFVGTLVATPPTGSED